MKMNLKRKKYYTIGISHVAILHITTKPNINWSIKDTPLSYGTTIIYMRKGSASLIMNNNETNNNGNDNDIPTHSTSYLSLNGNVISLKAGVNGSEYLLLTGEPINEPTKAHGSILMNTDYGIDLAYNDYNSGKMGRPWDHGLTDNE